jgi:membrane-bound ClpP family serine protease
MITKQPFPLWGIVGITLVILGFFAMDLGFNLDALWVISCGCVFVFMGIVVSIL